MNDTPSSGALLHILKVAERLGLSEYQTRGLVERGELAATKIGNRTYIHIDVIDAYEARAKGMAS